MKAKIIWIDKYSSTDEPDKNGRWARTAWVGRFDNFGCYRGKIAAWQIAWVGFVITDRKYFTVSHNFPCAENHVFNTLDEAKHAVEEMFNLFINSVIIGSKSIPH
jgi:hypothetical protein